METHFEIVRYTPERKKEWDGYVAEARNSTFLFRRDYMEYHADRFADWSLMFYRNGRLHSLLPAHRKGDTLCSHSGLTYGGLIMKFGVTAMEVVGLFEELNEYLRKEGFRSVIYKPVPWIYQQHASEEDLYAIFWKCGARLLSRNIGTVIMVQQRQEWRKDHRRRLRLAHESGVRVVRDGSLSEFWQVLEDNLQKRFNSKPVHSLAEIELLKNRFPNDIIQYNAYIGDEIVGGLTFYVTPQVLRGQYSSTNERGKQCGAMEAIYEQVLFHDYKDMLYLDFGTSSDPSSDAVINEGLISHKEGYGGRAICFDTYEWEIIKDEG